MSRSPMRMYATDVPEQVPGAGMQRIRRLLPYLRPYRTRAVGGVLAMLVGLAVSLAAPLLIKQAIDEGITAGDLDKLTWIVVIFALIGVVGLGASAAQTYLVGWTGERVLTDLRTAVFDHLQRLSLGYYERSRAGVLISRLTNDIEALQQLVTDGVTSSVQNVLMLVGATAILFWLDWRLALAAMAVFPIMAVMTFFYRRISVRAYRRLRGELGNVTATIQEDTNGVRVIQAFGHERTSYRTFLAVNGRYRDANQQTVGANAYYFPGVELLAAIATAIVFGYGGWLYIEGEVALGTLVAFVGYLNNFFDPVQQLSQVYNTFLSASAALEKIFGVLDSEPDIVDAPDGAELRDLRGDVAFRDVTFGYDPARPVIRGLELEVAAGTTVALVGHTGAGKSTIVKLIARFYDPQQGSVQIDGRDVRGITLDSLRSQIAIVPQESFLFAGTVRENIAFGRPEATLEEVRAAAEAVGAHDFITALPDGYETRVQERGSRLSIGQRQLVAFARALLVDPRLLILDEATSSVDLATEAHIEEALETLLRGRTAFVVAHRLSTIRRADLIVVLENGAVQEAGTHDELLAQGGRYRALYGDWVEAVA